MQMSHGKRPDLVGLRPVWFILSSAIIITGLIFWRDRGLNKGIDFTGGTLLKYEAAAPVVDPEPTGKGDLAAAYDRIRKIVAQHKIQKHKVQVTPDGRYIFIRTPAQSDEEAEEQLNGVGEAIENAFATTLTKTRDIVGPVIGRELGLKAVKALILGLVLILIFVTWRYEFRFAVAAIIALVHDVLLLVGVFAITQREIDSSFVPVLLTVVGYSINDTIVIFDRIRENMRLYRRERFDLVVNASLWQTMARSIITSLTTLFTLVALYFLGGPTIHDFAFGLIVGIATGAYSSIFVASPVVVAWRAFAERRREAAAALPRAPMPSRASPPPTRRPRRAQVASEAPSAATQTLAPQPSDVAGGATAPSSAARGTKKRKKKRGPRARTRRRRF